jgi:predicted transcriptional regulator
MKKTLNQKPKPTDGELEILRIIWKNGHCTVAQVNEVLQKVKDVGYTTTLKLMQIMHSKGLLSREKTGKKHTYTAEVSQDDTRKQVVDRVMDVLFHGSAMELVMHTLGNNKSSSKEITEIREYLKRLEGGNSDE